MLRLFMHIKCTPPPPPPTSLFHMGRRPSSITHSFVRSFSLSLSRVSVALVERVIALHMTAPTVLIMAVTRRLAAGSIRGQASSGGTRGGRSGRSPKT